MKYFLLLLFSFQLQAQTTSLKTSYVPLGFVLPKEGYEFHLESRLWNSSSNFDEKGNKTDFGKDEKYNVLDVGFTGRYGATNDLEFRGMLNWRQNRSHQAGSDGIFVDSTHANVQGIGVGAQYAFPRVGKNWQYSLDVFYHFRPYSNPYYELSSFGTNASTDLQNKRLVLGDEGNDYGGGLILTYESSTLNYFSSRIIYRRPGNELSNEINYQFEGALAFKTISVLAGVTGIYSMNDIDEDDDTVPQATDRFPYLGKSRLYYSVNREFYQPYAGFNVRLGKGWRIEARTGYTPKGESTDKGSFISLALAKRHDETQVDLVDQKFKEYSIEANVVKVSAKRSYVIIDKGLTNAVQKGSRFDFFFTDYVGKNELIARGIATQVNSEQAVIKITSRFTTKYEIKEGTIARAYLTD